MAAGHDVVVNHRAGGAQVDALMDELSRDRGRAMAVRADVNEDAEVDQLVRRTIDRFGRVDCVVNNAGVGTVVPLEHLDVATFRRTLDANLVSAFRVSQAAWPNMVENGGRLVFLSSGAARTGGGLSAAYAASKAGIEGLMHTYATRLRPHRITANAIAPTLIESDMSKAISKAPLDDLPLGRLGRLDEVWPVLRMILETEYLTGQTIHLDAGRHMT